MKNPMKLITGIVLVAGVFAGCGSSSAGQRSASASTGNTANNSDTGVTAVSDEASLTISSTSAADTESENITSMAASSETSTGTDNSNILVLYFDQGMNSDGSGYTEVDAITSASLAGENPVGVDQNDIIVMKNEIVERTGADEYPVLINETYADNYSDMVDVAQEDQDEDKQFTFRNELPDLSSYDTIFIGMPVWWGSLPQPMVNVFEQLDFSGKQVIPFGIHLGSGFGNMISQIEEFEPYAEVSDDGLTISGHTANSEAETDVDNWLDESFPDLEK